jgi:alanine racemase
MAFITINKRNYFHNLSQLALKAGSKERLAVVLKDNAYGHGLEIMARLSSEYGIREAVVVSVDEAQQIKAYFERILILNDVPFEEEKFSFAVMDMQQLYRVDSAAKIELKVDTGMHRNGIRLEELDEALRYIRERDLNFIGVMTHYRSADVLSSELLWQKKNFEWVKQRVRKAGFEGVRFHSHNSAALLRSHHFDEEIARVGIAIYGYNELPDMYDRILLRPVLSLHARRASTRLLRSGERIGYGGDCTAPDDMTVSTYDLGYGGGWPRGDAHNPYVTAEGLPILGRVSMDFISLEGDRESVCILEDAQAAAEHFGTISYEITTRLSATIAREVIEE